jgi:hypothetical protein
MGEQPSRLQGLVRKVLGELVAEALLFLKDPRLEVKILPGEGFSVWAHFPVYRRRIARELRPRPQTRVLLVFCLATLQTESAKLFADRLRDHLGHVLLYLRDPKARNGCAEAQKEWRASVKPKRAAAGKKTPAGKPKG